MTAIPEQPWAAVDVEAVQAERVARMRRMHLNGSLPEYCSWVLQEVAAGRRRALPVRATERELQLLLVEQGLAS